jgi:hypothetical protein
LAIDTARFLAALAEPEDVGAITRLVEIKSTWRPPFDGVGHNLSIIAF